jgi:hypothetical protein
VRSARRGDVHAERHVIRFEDGDPENPNNCIFFSSHGLENYQANGFVIRVHGMPPLCRALKISTLTLTSY